VGEELERDSGNSGERDKGEQWSSAPLGTHRQHAEAVRQARRWVRAEPAGIAVDMVPMVEANGNKPISPLSVTAEPRCVSVKELQLGRRSCL
jgi:hypothetical protein